MGIEKLTLQLFSRMALRSSGFHPSCSMTASWSWQLFVRIGRFWIGSRKTCVRNSARNLVVIFDWKDLVGITICSLACHLRAIVTFTKIDAVRANGSHTNWNFDLHSVSRQAVVVSWMLVAQKTQSPSIQRLLI